MWGMWGCGDGECMATEGMGACMMDEKDGNGDGECGKVIWVIGTPPEGVCEVTVVGSVVVDGKGEVRADMGGVTDGKTTGAEVSVDMTTPDAVRRGTAPWSGACR